MKIITSLLLLTIIFLTLNAEESVSIDAQIAKIQSAPQEERVKLMNAFKYRLSNMNTQERSVAIQELQVRMNSNTNENSSQFSNTSKRHDMQMQTNSNTNISQMQNIKHEQIKSHSVEIYTQTGDMQQQNNLPNYDGMGGR